MADLMSDLENPKFDLLQAKPPNNAHILLYLSKNAMLILPYRQPFWFTIRANHGEGTLSNRPGE
jgi:hypothetical protein